METATSTRSNFLRFKAGVDDGDGVQADRQVGEEVFALRAGGGGAGESGGGAIEFDGGAGDGGSGSVGDDAGDAPAKGLRRKGNGEKKQNGGTNDMHSMLLLQLRCG